VGTNFMNVRSRLEDPRMPQLTSWTVRAEAGQRRHLIFEHSPLTVPYETGSQLRAARVSWLVVLVAGGFVWVSPTACCFSH
jgi:hypothetical protein